MYKSLSDCIADLEKNGHLLRIPDEVDPHLEMAEIHRRVFARGGPALLFERVKGSPFPAVSNLYGTWERIRFIFRKQLPAVKQLVALKGDPLLFLKKPVAHAASLSALAHARPKRVRTLPADWRETTIDQLPQVRSWPADGGAFITLPQVLTLDPDNPRIRQSNLGMYRVQLSGNDYKQNRQVGLHYQIERGIGIHHSRALAKGQPLKVSIFVGGPPAHTLAAVMPLPEGLSELLFAGALAGRRFRYLEQDGWIISTEADFCILGTVEEDLLPEGPFGDHLGYYSLRHLFPVLRVEKVLARKGAVWSFTVVGRPPQEDSLFGRLIHEISGPAIPQSLPGVRAVNAVDEAGVHPLLLALGSERYWAGREQQPMELLKQANAILGFGQLSLAKYLFIAAEQDDPKLDVHNVTSFLSHILKRVDWRRDIHFQTRTSIDTLDYSGTALNKGSKAVIAACGPARRQLGQAIPAHLTLPAGFVQPKIITPGVLLLQTPPFESYSMAARQLAELSSKLKASQETDQLPLLVLVDDSAFAGASLANFLWVTFTRSNPSHDIYGVDSFTEHKHWGCHGPLIIDARSKPHHAPPLESDKETQQRAERLFKKGGPLNDLI